ncbi:hypothetical protein Tco_0921956 [Tanacetum coccineum]|uniref:Uncharacterized protein n=1 Tax=Tanacetum coccineum TaxID=301880 RepID=A0ABQ5CYG3_9ASTR
MKTASTPIETQKPLVKDKEAMMLDVTPKSSHLSAIKRIFRYLKGKPKLGLWYPRVSLFDLESYSNSDYAGANLDRKSIKQQSTDCAKLVPLGKVSTAIETLKKNTAKALISLLTTITLSTTMAVLDSCPKHNMVAYLEKTEGNAEFHEIIDFLNSAVPILMPHCQSLEVPNESQTDSSPAHTSKVPIEQQTDPSPRPSPSTIIPDSIPETSGGNLGVITSR